jgi:hypothetical protein
LLRKKFRFLFEIFSKIAILAAGLAWAGLLAGPAGLAGWPRLAWPGPAWLFGRLPCCPLAAVCVWRRSGGAGVVWSPCCVAAAPRRWCWACGACRARFRVLVVVDLLGCVAFFVLVSRACAGRLFAFGFCLFVFSLLKKCRIRSV